MDRNGVVRRLALGAGGVVQEVQKETTVRVDKKNHFSVPKLLSSSCLGLGMLFLCNAQS